MASEDTKMFKVQGKRVKTWNPIGRYCEHKCDYCFVKGIVPRFSCEDCRKEVLHFHPERLARVHKSGIVFPCDITDLMGDFIPEDWRRLVFETMVKKAPKATFYVLTKNPAGYRKIALEDLPNIYLGATIETDIQEKVPSKAPPVGERIAEMSLLEFPRKFLSIEPIIDFSDGFIEAIASIEPVFVYVGYDNWAHKLQEPSRAKTEALIKELESFTEVRRKTIRKAWWETSI